ncbi:helix-turn-helix domain-containing protein [Streptomyces sp. NPDC058122]|uniref:helix-turn-helix domain-containing protein n=1 Tax=Streptomyces sp. NPDC058122 TaxID=3346349 RepID=UPI0036EB6604
MTYPQGGGLPDERRFFREKLRLEAAERFSQGDKNTVIARDLRVSVRSVQRCRKAWSQDEPGALASMGPESLLPHFAPRIAMEQSGQAASQPVAQEHSAPACGSL